MNIGRNPLTNQMRSQNVKRVVRNFLGTEHFSWIALGLAVLFFVMAGWIPDGITNILLPGGDFTQGLWQICVALTIFAILGLTLSRKIDGPQNIRVEVRVPEAAKVLEIFLSPIGRSPGREHDILDRLAKDEPVASEELNGTSWEMPLIAINHHLARLELLVVVTSQGEGGSALLFPAFKNLLAQYFPDAGFTIEELTTPDLNFEDLAGVHTLLDAWYGKVSTLGRHKNHDIITDLTGGQKPASIAAALATLVEGRKFQYVSTTDKKVQSFDLVVGN
jgi:hypothetical protein